ncbi:GerAB/ArcD/ProY family transporter [Tuberibacillus sp. Marseille-P3662]|uniref:GerAB/ArcD/ProY family transporter n=1 Tax=Tuberibacillus sp. Marseille-P3662 TaxID=1965358 RepID=UPI000A1CAC4E|nr:endospore germination permease [Tuberibacillus sp. Marseille-P3662]
MKQTKLSARQLFVVMISFEIGTTVVFGVGTKAGQDAWLAILVAMVYGLVLMKVYTKLAEYHPGDTLVQIIRKICGRVLGYPLIVIYILYFIYSAARNCRDLGELIVTTILNGTPLIVVIAGFMIIIIYCLRGGIEVFGRMGEMILPVFIFSLVITWVLLFGSQLMDFQRITPVLGEGLQPIWQAAFPQIVAFPFGELVLILMFFPALADKRKINKVGLAIVFFGGGLLALNTLITISVLGPKIYGREIFPFFAAARMISIADFLERVDTIVILIMVAGVFFKVGAWTYGAAIGMAQCFQLKTYKAILLPLAVIIAPLSVVIASNITEHLNIGLKVIPFYTHVFLQAGIPILLLVISFIRKKKQSSTESQ